MAARRRLVDSLDKVLLCVLCVAIVDGAFAGPDLPVVHVDRDNFEVRESARIVITAGVIADADGSGVIHVVGDGLTVDFANAHLRGAEEGAEPDQYTGIGVRVTGRDITIRNGRFSGYKVAIHALDADRLTIEDVDVSDNFRQRLRSTPDAEDPADRLQPHVSDAREWLRNYGAGVAIESSHDVTVRRVRARNVQNGIVLVGVGDSRIDDNDCSFLSGWGLVMWRGHRNTISRNAFDFCVRGYSHGAYSAAHNAGGILLLEQSSNNVIAENSATHGGVGLIAHGGREASGKVEPRDDLSWYRGRGISRNIIVSNDFSYAALHGIDLAFAFENAIVRNRIVGSAACGVRGRFVHESLVSLNTIEDSGEMPHGREYGGVAIEHGHQNRIQENWFQRNRLAIRLWSRGDDPMLALPWAMANHRGSSDNSIVYNDFVKDTLASELLNTTSTRYGRNDHYYVAGFLEGDESLGSLGRGRGLPRVDRQQWDDLPLYGDTTPVGARSALRGRERIVLGEWGPLDWSALPVIRVDRTPHEHAYFLSQPAAEWRFDGEGAVVERDENERALLVRLDRPGRVVPYSLEIPLNDGAHADRGVLVGAVWQVQVFPWNIDPRDDVDAWRSEANIVGERGAASFVTQHLHLPFYYGGPTQLRETSDQVRENALPADRFGTIARTRLTFPAGSWRIRTRSADGVRVWLDDVMVIDDWTGVPGVAQTHAHEFAVETERSIPIRVEHFDLEGWAVLRFDVEAVAD